MKDVSRVPWPQPQQTLAWAVEHDKAVCKRGVPSLPRVKFLEGPGPERYDDADTRAA